jgi:hypothetical protein
MKEEWIAGLKAVRRDILDLAATLPEAEQDRVFLGVWSAKDLLAHLVGWDYTNIEAAKEMMAGQVPTVYQQHDAGWRSYNAMLVGRYRKEKFAELLVSVEESHRALIDFLEGMPVEEFEKDRGLRVNRYKVTIARFLQAEIKDEQTHYEQLKRLKR